MASIVGKLFDKVQDFSGWQVLDAGCGEGKNAHFLSAHGASVYALDISNFAMANAQRSWGLDSKIVWEVGDIRNCHFSDKQYDLVIGYGLLHCLDSSDEIMSTIRKMQKATKIGGYNIICSFNDRYQDLAGHPNFHPCLVSHEFYLRLYHSPEWAIVESSDSDLKETHPHNNIPHCHSLTRLLARREMKS